MVLKQEKITLIVGMLVVWLSVQSLMTPYLHVLIAIQQDESTTTSCRNSSSGVSNNISATIHDKTSLTSYMWYKGKSFDPLIDERPATKSSRLTIDAVSIGSQYAVHQLEGQAASWASHSSMRYFFGTTEQDDAHPSCHTNLTQDQMQGVLDRCRSANHDKKLFGIRAQFPQAKWLKKSNKTQGWMCGNKRFPHSLGKVGRFYRRDESTVLPDFLLIGDDDTWYGMNYLTSTLLRLKDQTVPHVAAGCMVQMPFHMVNFSFPFGGFGFVLNRNAIQRLIQPIYCNATRMSDPHTQRACKHVQENLAGERAAFQDGMSVSDLMDRHAAMLPYTDYQNWPEPGYCMIGDWILGYYINQYEIGSREDPELDYQHIDASMGHIYRTGSRSCGNGDYEKCRQSKTPNVCHRLKPDQMMELHMLDAKKY